jgi:hypothetical protein
MAIKKLPSEINSTTSIALNFDNGDYEILHKIKQQWNFKDEESLLRFALAILYKAGEHSVSVKDDGGNEITLKPTENMLQKAS